jgi:hypothetical protein
MAQGKKGGIAPVKQNIRFSKFLDDHYEPWAEAGLKSGKAILKRLRACYGWLLTKPVASISQWNVEKWRYQRLKAGNAAATVNRDCSALKAALNKAVEWELLDSNPIAKLKSKKVDNVAKARYLSDGHTAVLADHSGYRSLCYCGGEPLLPRCAFRHGHSQIVLDRIQKT